MTDDLAILLKKARSSIMTQGEFEAQRRSFAYGSANIENEHVSRETVRIAAVEIENRRTQTVSLRDPTRPNVEK